jgi:hypothetical protein
MATTQKARRTGQNLRQTGPNVSQIYPEPAKMAPKTSPRITTVLAIRSCHSFETDMFVIEGVIGPLILSFWIGEFFGIFIYANAMHV